MARRPTGGQIIRYTAGDIRVLISSDDIAGAMSMTETISAPGRGPTWHCHSTSRTVHGRKSTEHQRCLVRARITMSEILYAIKDGEMGGSMFVPGAAPSVMRKRPRTAKPNADDDGRRGADEAWLRSRKIERRGALA